MNLTSSFELLLFILYSYFFVLHINGNYNITLFNYRRINTGFFSGERNAKLIFRISIPPMLFELTFFVIWTKQKNIGYCRTK